MRILRGGLLMVEGICMLFFGQRFTGKGTITTTKTYTQQTFTCSKFTIKTLEEGVKYVQR